MAIAFTERNKKVYVFRMVFKRKCFTVIVTYLEI